MSIEYRTKASNIRAVLDAAFALINERGYDGATIRAIAKAAGLSPAGVLEHFPSKRELFFALIARTQEIRIAAAHAALEAASADPKAAILAAFSAAYRIDQAEGLRFVRETAALTFSQPSAFSPRLIRYAIEFYRPIADLMVREREKGVLRADIKVPVAVTMLSGAHFELLKITAYGPLSTLDYDATMGRMIDMLWRGMLASADA